MPLSSRARDSDLSAYYLSRLPERKECAILDFGCGHGRVMEFLFDRGFTNVTGFERETSLASEQPARVKERTFFGADWKEFLHSQKEPWDSVVLKDVIYYFDDAGALEFLLSLRSHMCPGGSLLVEVFNGACLTGPFVKFKDRGIQRIFTEHSIASLLGEAGFEVSYLAGMKPRISGIRSLAFFAGSRLWNSLLHLIYWLERGSDSQNPTTFEKKIFVFAKLP